MKRLVLLSILVLAGCQTVKSSNDLADRLQNYYSLLSVAANLCIAGIPKSPCGDPNVSMAIRRAKTVADVAVAEAIKDLRAATDQSAADKAMAAVTSAIKVIEQALDVYGVSRTSSTLTTSG